MRPLSEIVRASKRMTQGSAAVTAEQLREHRSLFWEGGSGPYPGFPPLGRSFASRVHVYVPRKRDRVIVEGGTIYDPRVFVSLRELVAAMPRSVRRRCLSTIHRRGFLSETSLIRGGVHLLGLRAGSTMVRQACCGTPSRTSACGLGSRAGWRPCTREVCRTSRRDQIGCT